MDGTLDWVDHLAVKASSYVETATYELLLAKKRQAVAVSVGPRRWRLIHLEADPGAYALPVGWKWLFELSGDFVTIARRAEA